MVFKRLIKREKVFDTLNLIIAILNFIFIVITGLLRVRTEFLQGMSFGINLFIIVNVIISFCIDIENTKRAETNAKYLKRGLFRDEI